MIFNPKKDVNNINSNIHFYPNPVKDIININDIENIESTTITDITGKIVINKKLSENNTIDISELERGVYIISIKTSTEINTNKIVKK